jgi:hypothetical protein
MRRVAPIVLGLTLALGIAGGLVYTWILDPMEIRNTTPDALRTSDKLVYLALIGDLYALEGDLAQAEARLGELGIDADGEFLAGLIEQYLDGGGQPDEVRNLARLAEALGASGGVLLVFADPPLPSPEPVPTEPTQPWASPTPAPSPTPVPTFQLVEQTAVCAGPGQPGQIAVRVRDASGNELPGIELVVSWSTGQDRFFTGLWPEQGAGYADFDMAPQVEYEVALASFRSDVAEGLTSELVPGLCPTSTMALDWRVAFQQTQ